MPNTIFLGPELEPGRIKSEIADEELTPGEHVEFDADEELQKHATAGGDVTLLFVREKKDFQEGLDDTYAIGDSVEAFRARTGDRVFGWLAASQTISRGDVLESDGAGNFQAHTPVNTDDTNEDIPTNAVRVRAGEDKTTTGSRERIELEIV